MMMRGKLSHVYAFALASCAAVLLIMTTFAGRQVCAQTPAPRQTRARRTAPPSVSQTGASRSSPSSQSVEADAQADLSITAHVTARELRFEKVPNPTVEFKGRPRRETVWEAERENLPEEVRPGVTYRNIGIRLRITSVFADIDRIVAEALGEIPASEDQQPQGARPEQPATPPRNQDDLESRRANSPESQDAAATLTQALAPRQNTQTAAAPKPSPAKATTNFRTTQRRRLTRAGKGQ
jgi:hypothetical protein